jgi:hypothetical protein
VIARIVTALYFLIGIVVAVNQNYTSGIEFSADGLWKLANFVLAVGFWPIIVLTSYDFRLPDALLRQS